MRMQIIREQLMGIIQRVLCSGPRAGTKMVDDKCFGANRSTAIENDPTAIDGRDDWRNGRNWLWIHRELRHLETGKIPIKNTPRNRVESGMLIWKVTPEKETYDGIRREKSGDTEKSFAKKRSRDFFEFWEKCEWERLRAEMWPIRWSFIDKEIGQGNDLKR